MSARWIVDVDGRGGFAVAAEGEGLVSPVQPLARCERLVARLREKDAARLVASRREAGLRLARSRQR